MGRFRHFLDVTDPRTLFVTDLPKYQKLLADYKEGVRAPETTDDDLWYAKKVVDSVIHPVTGEVLPWPVRMSAIAPVNIPIVYFMLTATSPTAQLFLQWLNQTYNSACNYYNRSGAEISMSALGEAYGLAVAASCGLAYGLGKAIQKAPPSIKRFGVLVPYLAVASANVSNVCFTRKAEITDGVPVVDEEGNVRGISKTAGLKGVVQSAGTRATLLPMACMLLPPVVMGGLNRMGLSKVGGKVRLGVELAVIYASLQLALPGAIAVFPQRTLYQPKDLEPEFHSLKDSMGRPVTALYANKGL